MSYFQLGWICLRKLFWRSLRVKLDIIYSNSVSIVTDRKAVGSRSKTAKKWQRGVTVINCRERLVISILARCICWLTFVICLLIFQLLCNCKWLSPAVTADLTGLFHRPLTARHILHSSETTWVSPCSMCLVVFVAFMRGINNWRISILLADLIDKLNLCPVLVDKYHFAHTNAWVWPILLSHDCKAKLCWIQLYYATYGRTTPKPHWFPSLKLVLSSLMCGNTRNMFKLNQSLTWQKAKTAQLAA